MSPPDTYLGLPFTPFTFIREIIHRALMRNDQMEAHLTKLASMVHLRTTNDRIGAQEILAIKPPGSSVLPPWLATRANDVSRSADMRNQRVRRSKGKGKGKGKNGQAGADE